MLWTLIPQRMSLSYQKKSFAQLFHSGFVLNSVMKGMVITMKSENVRRRYKNLLFLAPLIYAVFIVAVRYFWMWIIPDIFPGAVEQGLIAAELSWCSASKLSLAILISLLFVSPFSNSV